MDMRNSGPRRLALIVALLWTLVCPGSAAAGDELFETDVPVESQQPDLRPGYMKAALQDVLVRVTGQPDVMTQAALRAMLANPERFVEQYRYYNQPDSVPPRLMLRVRFDGAALQQALRQQGVAYWGNAERPEVLLWLAVEDHGLRYIVSAQDESEAARQIREAARQRGIPLLLPLLDLEDQGKVRFADVWGGFYDGVDAASPRYNPGVVLIGRLNRTASGSWVARWDLRDRGSWSGGGEQLGDALRAGIETLSGRLVAGLAAPAPDAASGATSITVDGVDTLTAFARVDDYLASLASVRRLELSRVEGSTLQYALQLSGGLDGLTQTLAIGTVLEPVPGGAPGAYRMRQ
jgi:hypothetical protein